MSNQNPFSSVRIVAALLAAAVVSSCSSGPEDASEYGDLALTGASIYTLDENMPWAETVVVRDDTIIYVGNAEGASELIGESTDVHDLAQPIDAGGQFSGVVVVEVSDCPETRLPEVVQQLQTATAYLPLVLGDPAMLRSAPSRSALESALWMVGSCLEHDRFRGAATSVATDMAAQLGCERVAIGFVEAKQSKVQALSHSADFAERMNLIRRVSAAMDEAVDQRTSIVLPMPPGQRVLGTSARAMKSQVPRREPRRVERARPYCNRPQYVRNTLGTAMYGRGARTVCRDRDQGSGDAHRHLGRPLA